MNTIERARFVKLVEFLEDLPIERFNFAQVVSAFDDQKDCGTVCCAMGWTPRLFPDFVQWSRLGECLVDAGNQRIAYEQAALILFGIHPDIAIDLFAPDQQHEVSKKLDICGEFATPGDVAFMLNQFLALVDSGEINPMVPVFDDFDPEDFDCRY